MSRNPWLDCFSTQQRTPSIAGSIYNPRPKLHFHQTTSLQKSLAHPLVNAIVPLNTLDPPTIARPLVEVDARVVGIILPAAQHVARADSAVLGLAAVEVPGSGGEVDGVAGVVHGHVDVVVAVVLVGGGALSAV